MPKLCKITNIFRIWVRLAKNYLASQSKYRIVDHDPDKNIFGFQCSMTGMSFRKDLLTIVRDIEFIKELPPEQACYLGIMFGKHSESPTKKQTKIDKSTSRYIAKNYSTNLELTFTRDRKVIFIHPITNNRCVMELEHVIANKNIIRLFPADTTFVLGMRYSRLERLQTKNKSNYSNVIMLHQRHKS